MGVIKGANLILFSMAKFRHHGNMSKMGIKAGFNGRLIFTSFIWWENLSSHWFFSAKQVMFACSLEIASFLLNSFFFISLAFVCARALPHREYNSQLLMDVTSALWNTKVHTMQPHHKENRCKLTGACWRVVQHHCIYLSPSRIVLMSRYEMTINIKEIKIYTSIYLIQ